MPTNVDIGERLKEERQRLGLKQADLAEATGVSRTSQVNYESGTRAPDATYLQAAATVGVDVLYVITGRRADAPTPERSTDCGDVIKIPLLGSSAVDAADGVAVGEPAGEYAAAGLGLPRSWLDRKGLLPEHLSVIEVRGGSMAGVLEEGDRVLVNLQDTQPRTGVVYVLRQGDELLVKYCQVLPGGIMRVTSADTAYAPYDVDLAKAPDVAIVGRVVASMHEW